MAILEDVKIETETNLKNQLIDVDIQRIGQDIRHSGFDIELKNLDLWINAFEDLVQQLKVIKKETENED